MLIFDINQRFLDANDRGREFISEYGLNPDGKFSFSEIENNKFLQKIGFPNQTVNDNSFFLYSLKTNKNFIVKKHVKELERISYDTITDDAYLLLTSKHCVMAAVEQDHETIGIITLEDIIEELIGNIYDEYN